MHSGKGSVSAKDKSAKHQVAMRHANPKRQTVTERFSIFMKNHKHHTNVKSGKKDKRGTETLLQTPGPVRLIEALLLTCRRTQFHLMEELEVSLEPQSLRTTGKIQIILFGNQQPVFHDEEQPLQSLLSRYL